MVHKLPRRERLGDLASVLFYLALTGHLLLLLGQVNEDIRDFCFR